MAAASRDIRSPASPNPAPSRPRFWTAANIMGVSLVGIAFLVLAALSWRKWPDVIVDFGSQLYIPWRLSEGAVLYRDLFYFAGGPFSQYFNAALFKIFGVSLSTLLYFNLACALGLLWLVYRRFVAVADTFTATVICLGIVSGFTFAEYTGISNYNFIAPYTHEIVHGLLLSLLAVCLLEDWLQRQRPLTAGWIGLLSGLVFMTKPDIFLALAVCILAAIILRIIRRGGFRWAARSAAIFLLGLVAPLLLFFLIFLRAESWQESLRSVAFGWLPVFRAALTHSFYYLSCIGMDRPWANIREVATHFGCAVLVLALYAIFLRNLDRLKSRHLNSRWLLGAVLGLPLWYWSWNFQWTLCGWSLPLWCLAILIILGRRIRRSDTAHTWDFLFLWTVFALFAMAKLGLCPRIYNYGFALALPAFVVTIYFLLWLLPEMLAKSYGVPHQLFRVILAIAMLLGFFHLARTSVLWYNQKTSPAGHGSDQWLSYGAPMNIAPNISAAVDWVGQNLPPGANFATVPGGITLNYLSRRVNPTPCLFWDPSSLAFFGQDTMTARFEAAAPDYVMVVEQDESGFGVGYFGTSPEFGGALMQWLKQNYRPVVIVGAEPLKDARFGVEIYQRLTPTPTALAPSIH